MEITFLGELKDSKNNYITAGESTVFKYDHENFYMIDLGYSRMGKRCASLNPNYLVLTHSDSDHISGFSNFWNGSKVKPKEVWIPHDWIRAVLAAEIYLLKLENRNIRNISVISDISLNDNIENDLHIEIEDIFSIIDTERTWGISEIYTLANHLYGLYGEIHQRIDMYNTNDIISYYFSSEFYQQPFTNIFEKFSISSQRNLTLSGITPSIYPDMLSALGRLNTFKRSLAFNVIFATKKVRDIIITLHKSGTKVRYFSVDNFDPNNNFAISKIDTKLEIINANPKSFVEISSGTLIDWIRNTTESVLINERSLISEITYKDINKNDKKIIIWSDSSGMNVVSQNNKSGKQYKVDWNKIVIMTAPHHGSYKSTHNKIWQTVKPYLNNIFCISVGGVASQIKRGTGIGLYSSDYLAISKTNKSCCWCRHSAHKINQDIQIDLNSNLQLTHPCLRTHDTKNP